MAMKFRGWLQLGVRQAYLVTKVSCGSCCLYNPFPRDGLVYEFVDNNFIFVGNGKSFLNRLKTL